MKKLPTLTFQIKKNDFNITFTPNDYFKVEDDDIYFLIAHHLYKDSQCTGGVLFLKKYSTIFDVDSKQMRILKNEINNDKKQKGNNGVKMFFIVFFSIIFSGLIFGFVGLKYGKKIYQARKKKANELDDNYEYTQYKAKYDINYQKKYGLFSINEDNKNNSFNPNVSLEMTKS